MKNYDNFDTFNAATQRPKPFGSPQERMNLQLKTTPSFPNSLSPPVGRSIGRAFIDPKYGAGFSTFSAGTPAFPEEEPKFAWQNKEAPPFPVDAVPSPSQNTSRDWVHSRAGEWAAPSPLDWEGKKDDGITQTDRYEARQAVRAIGRTSPLAAALSRPFLRIDASTSKRDTLRPAPVEFAGNMLGNHRSEGFEGSAGQTAEDIRKDFGYAGLRNKYRFPSNPDQGGTVPHAF